MLVLQGIEFQHKKCFPLKTVKAFLFLFRVEFIVNNVKPNAGVILTLM